MAKARQTSEPAAGPAGARPVTLEQLRGQERAVKAAVRQLRRARERRQAEAQGQRWLN